MEKEIKHTDLINILLVVILIVTIIVNGIQNYFFRGQERFEWNMGIISSKGNIIQVSNCNFKGNSHDINKNMILNNGWDKINDSENNMTNTFFPDSLFITWFSYNEQKFYEGNFALPYETILAKSVQMGIFPSKNYTYRNDQILSFIAEVQPKGKLAVWIKKPDDSNNETKFKIGTYQAKETKATWHVFDDYSESDKTSNIDISKKIALVMEQHPYKVEVKLPIGYTLDGFSFYFFNQNDWSCKDNDLKAPLIFSSLPKEINLKWGIGKKKFSTSFSFDEDKVLDAFRKESSKSEPLVLELILSDRYDYVRVTLKNKETNSKVEFKDKY